MTKAKYLVLLFLVAVLMLVFPNIASAADYATVPAVVKYTRLIPSNDGTIKLNFTGLELDPAKPYEFALVRQGGTPENWFNIDDGYTATTASITLSSGTGKIVEVLKATDTGFIYVREKNNAEADYVLQAYQVNLKLPYLQSLAYTKDEGDKEYDVAKLLYGSIGNQYAYIGSNHNTYIKWQKITDRKLIEDYLNIKNNSGDISNLESSLPVYPTTGYEADKTPSYRSKEDGLYLLWVKRTGENCKDVYSCIVHDGLKEATRVEQYIAGLDVEKPTVQSIAVTSPKAGTYKTGQTVKITVTFSEEITGETVPTLKIKFGTSEERTLANGTISGKTIVYSYNIVDGDKGQLAVTGYAGGTIKDAAGNDATIELKVVSGNAIKANEKETGSGNGSGSGNNSGDDNGEGTQTILVESVTLDKAELTLDIGKKHTLVATVKPNNATNTAVEYTSSNEAVVKVDEKGVITAIAKGNATITVTTVDGQKTATCKVTVKDETIAKVEIPKAGTGLGITVAIMAIIITCVVIYSKYNKIRDI